MTIAEQIKKRIDELLADPARKNTEEWKIASTLQALPIEPAWMGYIAIRPDGSFLFRNDDGTVENSVEPEWQLIALIAGSRKYPELAMLLPQPAAGAGTCADCQGTGRGSFEGHQFEALICENCLGLGWVDEKIKALSNEARARRLATE